MIVRTAAVADHAAVLAMNNAATPHVNALTGEQFAWLAANADYFRLAEVGGVLAGFVMAIRSGTEYWSANYAWFGERFDRFIYLDRVVVAPAARRGGIGRALYTDLQAVAANTWPRITLEVNVQPPNPGSIAFHEALGFRRVGARVYGENEVAMFELQLTPSG